MKPKCSGRVACSINGLEMKAFLEGREHMKLDDADMRTEETARKSWTSSKLRVKKFKAGKV